ncbi:helix-turn-helix domain-containing protein [Streptomyces sp. WM6373]|uniref:helix-turn-helix domain-containing protein n=1 Tax=Streptomyces sp. WM6373 TaxID=1415556 RepID=UPI00099BD5A8|nr:helix-turn-helix domain-containing protein [Streptomyces sp. WM6373]
MSHADGVDRHTTAARRLGDALRALQQRSGMTLRDLEQRALISDSSLSRYFRGSTVPPWSVVREICRAMDTDPAGYRALWEAADRTQSRAPTGAVPAPDPSVPVPAPARVPSPSPSPEAERASPDRGRPDPVRAAGGRWRWTAAGLLAGLAVGIAGTVLLGGSPAPDAARVFRNKATETCLDDSVEGLRSWPCNGLHYQEWEFRPHGSGPGDLRNRATGACLDNSGAAPRARSCDGSTHQEWTVTGREDGTVQLRNLAAGTCLAAGPASLTARTCDGSDPQRWT